MSKRYVLVKSDGEGPKPCAFFISAAGCRNGAGCKFLHGDQPTAGSAAARANSTPATKPLPLPAATLATQASAPAGPTADEAAAAASAKKKAKKKAKKEKEAQATAAAAAAAAVAATMAAATPPNNSCSVVAAVPVDAVAVSPLLEAAPLPTTPAAEKILSPTKAKKQAFREKAAKKAAAAAAATAAHAAASGAPSGLAPPFAPAAAVPQPVAPASIAPLLGNTIAGGVGGTPVLSPLPVAAVAAPALVGATASSKKKKRKNKKKGAEAAAVSPAPSLAAPLLAVPLLAAPAAAAPTAIGPPPHPPGPPAKVFHSMPVMSALAAATGVPVLTAATSGSRRLCSFFNKKKGCKAGALCPFLHTGVAGAGFGGTRGHAAQPAASAPPNVQAPAPVAAAAVVATPQAATTAATAPPIPLPSPQPHLATAATAPSAAAALYVAPAVTPRAAATVLPPALAHGLPVSSTPPAAAIAPSTTAAGDSARRTRKRSRSTPGGASVSSGGSSVAGGLLDGLPISPFVMPGAETASTEATGSASGVAPVAPAGFPHPKADPWQSLVERTRMHPKYKSSYSFETDSSWIKAPPCGDHCAGLPQVVALDCEMCMSEDPVSKVRNGKELVRVSIVKGEDGQPLIDTLVRPGDPIVDWRTNIHGVAPQHLEGVLFTHRHAQAAMARICCQHTVMIGHALNNDLEALKMSHDRVVDTALIYEGSDKKFSTPSLKDVVKAALGKDIQDGSHDSITDAQCTLDVARYTLENGPQPPVTRTKKLRRHGERGHKKRRTAMEGEGDDRAAERRAKRVAEEEREARSLMVHRLPSGTTAQQLTKVVQKKTRIVAAEVDPIEFNGASGKTKVVYASSDQADLAFNTISTTAQEDTSGRLQKKIYISTDGKKHIMVRHAVIMNEDSDKEGGGGLPSLSSSSESFYSGSESESDDAMATAT